VSSTLKSTALALVFALGLAAPVVASSPAPSPPPLVRKTHAEMVQDTVDKYVFPHLEAFAAETSHLRAAMDTLCQEGAAPGPEARSALSAAFAAVVKAWAGVDFIRFGPGMQKNRIERVFFWPDPRTFTSRQLSQVLAKRDAATLAPGAIERQSVAVQGLTALEILIFDAKAPLGEGGDDAARYRCGFARAIAVNLETVAGELRTGWAGDGGYRMKMLAPGPDNLLYKDASESARDVVKALATGLDVTSNRFAIPELTAISHQPPKTSRLPFERAGLTSAFFVASLDALHELFDTTGLAAYIPADKPWMAKFFRPAWAEMDENAAHLDPLRVDDRGSEEHLEALRKMKFDLSGMRTIISKELAPNAGIVLGFNELDGD